MTHEPDIIEQAERIVMDTFRLPPYLMASSGLTTDEAADCLKDSGHIIHNLLTGLDNPTPGDIAQPLCSARFTYDGTQEDHGDVSG